MEEKKTASDPHNIFNEEKKRDRLVKRMLNAYRRNKRDKKISALESDPQMWRGLE